VGGLPRRAAFIRQEKAEDIPVLILDTGNFISDRPLAEPSLEPALVKADLILRAMDAMGYAVMAVGEMDLFLGPDRLRTLSKTTRVTFLSANVTDTDGKTVFEPHRILQAGGVKVGVIGLTAPPGDQTAFKNRAGGTSVKDPVPAAEAAVKSIRDKCDLLVVLSNIGYAKDLELAHTVAGIDVIISGGTKRFMKNPVIKERTLITSGYYEGRAIGDLAIYLAGDVKGWVSRYEMDLLNTQIKAAEAKTGTPAGKRHYESLIEKRDSAARMTLYEPDLISLDPTIPDDPGIVEMINDYRKELLNSSVSSPGQAAPRGERVGYTGPKACAACHEARYRFWLTTDHAGAFDALAPKNAGADPDCMGCHVTGYRRRTGYWPKAPRIDLRGVQCEACHGVGSLHVGSPDTYSLLHLPLAPLCMDCHTEDQDADFDYFRDKGKVCGEL